MAQERQGTKPAAPRATRLFFSYEGSEVRLDSQQTLEMRTPPSHSLEAQQEMLGFWYELQDASGRTLYRRITDNPIRFNVEVRTDDPERLLAWQGVERPRGSFVLLAPDVPEARSVVLFSSPLGPDGALEPARKLASFHLTRGSDEEGGQR